MSANQFTGFDQEAFDQREGWQAPKPFDGPEARRAPEGGAEPEGRSPALGAGESAQTSDQPADVPWRTSQLDGLADEPGVPPPWDELDLDADGPADEPHEDAFDTLELDDVMDSPRHLQAQAPGRRRRTRRTVRAEEVERPELTGEQRLLMLDTWLRSKLPAREFARMVGISQHTLYAWKKRFEAEGPAGLANKPRGARRGSRLAPATRRAILLMKQAHPDWGQDRIRDVLLRSDGYEASPGAIARVLAEEGYIVEHEPTRPHPAKVQRFERAHPNQLWQSDLFTFVLRRSSRRAYVVAFMDDHSRFIVGLGVHASASGALVREVFEGAIASWGAPREVLTDNGPQYHTWRGKSAFRRLCERRGIAHIVASPRRPQTLGKIERFWGTLWRETLESAIFRDLVDARRRIGLFVDYYNFQRPHQGIDGLVPADRYFAAAPQVLETLRARVASNALEQAQQGEARKPFYLTGRVGEALISLHAEGERVVLTHEGGGREEVDLSAPGRRADEGSESRSAANGHAASADGPGALLPAAAEDELEERALAEPITPQRVPADHPSTSEDARAWPPGTSPLDRVLRELGLREDAEDLREQHSSEPERRSERGLEPPAAPEQGAPR